MARRKKMNRRLRARQVESMATVPLPGVNDRVKLKGAVPGWGGRRGLVIGILTEVWDPYAATYLRVRLDKSGPVVRVLAAEVVREDVLGREFMAADTGSLWDVGASCFPAPDARVS